MPFFCVINRRWNKPFVIFLTSPYREHKGSLAFCVSLWFYNSLVHPPPHSSRKSLTAWSGCNLCTWYSKGRNPFNKRGGVMETAQLIKSSSLFYLNEQRVIRVKVNWANKWTVDRWLEIRDAHCSWAWTTVNGDIIIQPTIVVTSSVLHETPAHVFPAFHMLPHSHNPTHAVIC